MPRVARERKSYQPDILVLSRLAVAVEIDSRRSAEWKGKVIAKIHELSGMLAEVVTEAANEKVG